MRCPQCGCLDDKVIETRVSREGDAIRRRRACDGCGSRFTTYEAVVRTEKQVVKRDGRREDFNPEKLRLGLRKACWKRPIGETEIDELIRRVSSGLENIPPREVASQEIGEMVMAELQQLDEVAYVRFASVYRRFKGVDQFVNEIRKLTDQQEHGDPT